jgi:mannitol/fructose-specific phosphotransferase system IIA component (Ntr-type)
MIKELIDSALIVETLTGTTKADILGEILQKAVASGLIQKKDLPVLKKQLIDREALGSTGIGNGVAVPHVKGKEVKKISLILARSKDAIAFQAIDGRPVQTFFMILAPQDQPEHHIKALRWVSSLARNADFRRFVLAAKGETEIRELLLEMSEIR